ncbi:MAG: CRISPR-associated endoribonuclease Cas6 [Acidobacteriota bacterium]|nr:CRISPR-associated endoribonuclease Cas6 [Acidobacteriota bacterium]
MRLKMVFQLKKPELDIEYRRAFLSLLKDSFQQASPEVYDKFYGGGTPMKPFTFGVFLPNPVFKDNTIYLKGTEITLNFSTCLTDLGIYFYNSLIRRKRHFQPYPLANGNEMSLARVNLQKEKPVKSSEAVFKTLSPFLVRLHHKEDNADEYLTKVNQLFVPQVQENVRVMVEELLARKERVEFMPVTLSEGIPIKHYGIFVDGTTGIFKLTGHPEVLDFVYKVGIGSRRSEGFGMLELV